jgi:hypothetical protein
MPKRPSKESPLASIAIRDRAREERLRHVMEAGKSAASESQFSKLKLSTLLEPFGRLSQIQEVDLFQDQLKTLTEAVQRSERLETPLTMPIPITRKMRRRSRTLEDFRKDFFSPTFAQETASLSYKYSKSSP